MTHHTLIVLVVAMNSMTMALLAIATAIQKHAAASIFAALAAVLMIATVLSA